MKNRSSTHQVLLCGLLGSSLLLAAACGGRAVTIEDGTTAGGSTGASGSVGTGAVAGKPGHAGTSSAGSSSAGSTSSAGSGNSCAVNCPEISCPGGQILTVVPTSCCPVCACSGGCPDIDCADGYTLVTQPGECCPSCVPNTRGPDCNTGKMDYAATLSSALNKYSYGCSSDADCVGVEPNNRCGPDCQYFAIWQPVAADFTNNLSSVAATDCANCPVTPTPPCTEPAQPVHCLDGQCVALILIQ